MLVMVVCFIAFRWIHLSTPLIRLFLLVLILLLMPTLNFLPVWFALSQLRFFFSSRRRHTSSYGDWSSDVCSSDLELELGADVDREAARRRPLHLAPQHLPRRDLHRLVVVVDEVAHHERRLLEPGHRPRSEERRVGDEACSGCRPPP